MTISVGESRHGQLSSRDGHSVLPKLNPSTGLTAGTIYLLEQSTSRRWKKALLRAHLTSLELFRDPPLRVEHEAKPAQVQHAGENCVRTQRVRVEERTGLTRTLGEGDELVDVSGAEPLVG